MGWSGSLAPSAVDLVGNLRVHKQARVIKKHPFSLWCDDRLRLTSLPCHPSHGPYIALLLLFAEGQSGTRGLTRTWGEGVAGGVRWSRATQVSGWDGCGWRRRQHRLGPVEDIHLMAVLITVLLQLGKGGGAIRVVIHIQNAIPLEVKIHVHHYILLQQNKQKFDFRAVPNGTHYQWNQRRWDDRNILSSQVRRS